MNVQNSISVIIRTSNSEDPLRRLLSRIKLEDGDEIVIVDSGSKDGTLDVANQFGARIIRNEGAFNYSRTLNLGFGAAKNDWLLSLSSHCIPVNNDLLNRYRAAIAHAPASPAVLYGAQYWSSQQYAKADKDPQFCHGKGNGEHLPTAGNTNALYARDAWVKHPFDETLTRAEDWEWLIWAADAGLISGVAPEAAIYYFHQGNPVYRFRKAWDDTCVTGLDSPPMNPLRLSLALAQATKRLLFESRVVRPWIGQVAHIFGTFFASREIQRRRQNKM
jgi:rhamnosyltransferase